MTLLERIQKLCEENGTTLAGLERSTELSRGSIRLWDKNSPSVDKIAKVAKYFGVSSDYLLDIQDNNETKAQNSTEKKLLLLARKAADVPDEQRERIIKNFEDTIDIYLKAKGISKED